MSQTTESPQTPDENAEATQIDLTEVRVLRLQPGDTLVVRADREMSMADAERIHANLKEKFPEHEVLVFSSGLELSVARPGVSS